MKDNFSNQSNAYAKFRPLYPEALFNFMYGHCVSFEKAWDCATGNGQIARNLATRFQQVEATDISDNQLRLAPASPHIRYSQQAAETPDFPDDSFDLVVVGQAAHWFDFEQFYPQVQRVLKPGGLLVLVGYNLVKFNEPILDALVQHLYSAVLGNYWDPERLLVEAEYSSIPFPFDSFPFPAGLTMQSSWSREDLIGFFNTWSALQHFSKQHGHSPMDADFLAAINTLWPADVQKTAQFPIFGRAGFMLHTA